MNQRTRRHRKTYMTLWRMYYGIIMGASGFTIAYFSVKSGNLLFAVAVALLTIAAVGMLFLWTFRRQNRRTPVPNNQRRMVR